MKKWFDLNLGWIFINGRKQEQWKEYLEREYGTSVGSQDLTRFFQLVAYSALRAIGIPIVIVSVIFALPAIVLLALAEDLESRRNLDSSDE